MNKRYIIYLNVVILCTISLLFSACKKELMSYNGIEGIYFSVRHGNTIQLSLNPYQPYTKVEFVKTTKVDTTITLHVMVTGPTKPYDRPFNIEVITDSTTAEVNKHYSPIQLQHSIPANSHETYISIKLLRSADLKSTSKQLTIRLLPSDQLGLSFPHWDAIPGLTSNTGSILSGYDGSIHKILFDDVLAKPAIWSGLVLNQTLEAGNWGEFSEKKMLLMCEIMDLTYNSFESSETMPSILTSLITREMAAYLVERFNEGNPVLEEDGRLMYFSGVPWSSNIGVPYKK